MVQPDENRGSHALECVGMSKMKSQLPHLIFVCCIFLTFGLAFSSECGEKNCSRHFSCSNTQNCNCLKHLGEYELLCSAGGENYVLSSTVKPNSYIQILCTQATKESDYDTLRGLKVGPVEEVYFRLCPLPSTFLSEFLESIGIAMMTTFQFQSYRDLRGSLVGDHFRGLGNVTKLLLMNNNLTRIPPNFLRHLPGLVWLDLRENNLELDGDSFGAVPDLEVLELGLNKISTLDPLMLSNLPKLRILNVWNNKLRNVTNNAFSGLHGLEQLDLSSNEITSVSSDAFLRLEKLVQLSIYSNNFTSLPGGLLSGARSLEIFRLHDNHLPLVLSENFLSNLPKLTEVYLMRNNISSLPESIFWKSYSIRNISLQGNAISELPHLLLRDQKNLLTLDVSENRLQHLPDYVFSHLNDLKVLKLGFNRIKRITREVFYGLNSLELLDIEQNELHFVHGESLIHLTELKVARFSHNKLSFLNDDSLPGQGFPYRDPFGSASPFRNCLSLEYLYLSNNSVTEIFYDWQNILIRLRTLDLSYNKIGAVTTWNVHFLAENLSVDLRHNNISLIELQGVENLAYGQSVNNSPDTRSRIPRLLLSENPLNCDCSAYEFFRYFEKKLRPEVYLIVTLVPGDLRCSLPASLRGLKVSEVNSRDLTCRLDHSYDCPAACDCRFRRDDLGLIVNCSNSGLIDIPNVLPHVAGTSHTELLLDGNRISKLPNSTYPGYENVTHFHLSSNNITTLDLGLLSKRLQVLTLNNNNLTYLDSGTVTFLSQSDEIRLLTLHNNPWKCDCSARELLDLIQQKFEKIPFLSNVTCSDGQESLSKLSVSDLCPISVVVVVSCILAAIFGLLVGSIAAFYYRYQREVKVWLYSHHLCLWFVTEEELDKDKLYDVFVSYSHKDENFVINTLVPELESGENPFKLCLHYRDWVAGEWIPNQIARSVENSRRTLVILSPNFLESVWSRMEFRAAHKQALNEGRARVIVVLYGDVGPTEDLDSELRAYISMNTYVKWGDPWFWRKLKYALPHPPSLGRMNIGFIKKRSTKKEKKHIDDILELVHTLDPSGSPLGGTTPPLDGISNGNAVCTR